MTTGTQHGWKAADFGDWWDNHWEETIVTALPNLAALTMAFTSDEVAGLFVSPNREVLVQVPALLIAVAFFLSQWLVYPRYIRKQKKLSRLEKNIEELTVRLKAAEIAIDAVREGAFEDYKKIVRNYLRELSDEFGFRHTDRATLYYHQDHDGTFIPIEREAGNPAYRSLRRRSYPDKEGCIAEAWKKGNHFEVVPSDSDWVEWCASRGLKQETAACIRMRSRLYFAWRVKNREKTEDLAVLVLESESPTRWKKGDLLEAFERKQGRTLNDVLAQIKPQLPDSRMAAERGM